MDTTIQFLPPGDEEHGVIVAQSIHQMSLDGKQRVLNWLAAVINEEVPIGVRHQPRLITVDQDPEVQMLRQEMTDT